MTRSGLFTDPMCYLCYNLLYYYSKKQNKTEYSKPSI